MGSKQLDSIYVTQGETVCGRLVCLVADIEGVEVNELNDCLYDITEPELLELFSSARGPVSGCIEFPFCGYTVSLTREDGQVRITVADN